MSDVQVERSKLAAEMQFRVVIKGAAAIKPNTIIDRPGQNVPQGIEIKMQIERHAVIESKIFVVNCVAAHHGNAEGDDYVLDPPDEKARALGHALAERAKKFRR